MNSRISVDPNIHFGKPCVAGTRITVQNVLEPINAELTFEEIIRDYYPDLKNEDIKACLDTRSRSWRRKKSNLTQEVSA